MRQNLYKKPYLENVLLLRYRALKFLKSGGKGIILKTIKIITDVSKSGESDCHLFIQLVHERDEVLSFL